MRPLTLGFALLLFAFARPALPQAEAGAYNIEVIVFRTGADSPDAAGGGALPAGDDNSPSGVASVARLIGLLPAGSLQLGPVLARLRANGGYVPLASAGWTQTPSPWGSRSGFALARLGITADGLSGTAWLERGQYLHLGFSLRYGQATIHEIRRVRLGELNYFDNPAFGVIAVVTAAR
ncbi:MAG: hypothetical protein AB7P31_02215 [Steroidobacteraceae bacterium]